MKVKYFAWVRERVGKAEEMVEPPESVRTVDDLMAWLARRDGGRGRAQRARRRGLVPVRSSGAGADRIGQQASSRSGSGSVLVGSGREARAAARLRGKPHRSRPGGSLAAEHLVSGAVERSLNEPQDDAAQHHHRGRQEQAIPERQPNARGEAAP